jgi:hypothetical protein
MQEHPASLPTEVSHTTLSSLLAAVTVVRRAARVFPGCFAARLW